MLTMDMIYDAQKTLAGVARVTPLYPAPAIGQNIYIKAENLQMTGAFKLRGAYYKISCLTDEEKAQVQALGGFEHRCQHRHLGGVPEHQRHVHLGEEFRDIVRKCAAKAGLAANDVDRRVGGADHHPDERKNRHR